MKKPLVVLLLIPVLLFIACAGTPPEEETRPDTDMADSEEIPPGAVETLEKFEQAVRNQDTELFAEIVIHDDISAMFTVQANGQRTEIGGLEAVTEFRLMFFDQFGPQENYRNTWKDEPRIEVPGHNFRVVGFWHHDHGGEEWIHLRKMAGDEWKIHRLEVFMHPPGEWVTNRYQLQADYNGDGFLQEDELHELIDMTFAFYEEPHPVRNPVDEYFDWNRDGFIDEEEMLRTAHSQFVLSPLFMQDFIPEESILPQDWKLEGNTMVSKGELERIRDYMLHREDLPGDKGMYVGNVATFFAPDAVYLPVPREVTDLLDSLADGNSDGIIDEREQEYLLSSLVPWQKKGNLNPLEQVMDRNRDEEVFGGDILLLMQQSATGRGMAAEGAEPPYGVRTPTDSLLDANRDDRVSREEMDITVALLAGQVDLIGEMKPELQEVLDLDGDGRYEPWEIEEGKAKIIFPRPVDPDSDMDRESDSNRDGFIDPEELGITAGVTDKGMIPPFEEQIMMVQHRMKEPPMGHETEREEEGQADDSGSPGMSDPIRGSEYYRRLGTIQDKKLAVVSLDIGTDRVDRETATGIIVFIENAFVNVGKVKVVDRAHIEEIFEEMEFQMSGAIDENTAVEVGKLSGADIIVIGSINRVGDLFYLNTKLLDVETAEIIGSSIAQADSASGFLEMANQAVYKLF